MTVTVYVLMYKGEFLFTVGENFKNIYEKEKKSRLIMHFGKFSLVGPYLLLLLPFKPGRVWMW